MKKENKRFRFDYKDIAAAVGKSEEAVKKEKVRGKFDPNDLLSLSKYVIKHHLSI